MARTGDLRASNSIAGEPPPARSRPNQRKFSTRLGTLGVSYLSHVARERDGMIRHIAAATFAVHDMPRSIEFYRKLGFELVYGDERATFSSLKAGDAFVNLVVSPAYEHRWWGRVIFRVADVDGHQRSLQEHGLAAELPRNAPWGERFFHIIDPDGHELSFTELLSA